MEIFIEELISQLIWDICLSDFFSIGHLHMSICVNYNIGEQIKDWSTYTNQVVA